MKKMKSGMGLIAALLASSTAAHAQDTPLTWQGSVEIGVDSTIRANDPAAKITDGYLSIEAAFEATLTDRLSVFGALTLETVTDASDNRAFEDMGLYIPELGLRYTFGDTVLSAGKISPVFAVAWDAAPGFYGTALAEDYELGEMIGLSVDTPAGAGGSLSFAVFYADDTGLSNSIGTKRGRNSLSAGGAGNTGKLDNVAAQYTRTFGETTAWIGARHLSASQGELSDETGLVAGLTHDFGNGFDMIGEVARLDGGDDATYATVGGAYAVEAWTFSATATLVAHSGGPNDRMIALGVDRSLSDSTEVNFGLARFDVRGETSTAMGLAAVFSF